jgi:hypothetical protein
MFAHDNLPGPQAVAETPHLAGVCPQPPVPPPPGQSLPEATYAGANPAIPPYALGRSYRDSSVPGVLFFLASVSLKLTALGPLCRRSHLAPT